MKVFFPKKMLSDKILEFLQWSGYKKVEENEESVIFEGPFSFVIDFDSFGIPRGMRRELYNRLRVEGGRKYLATDRIEVTSCKNRRIFIRVSEEELDLLRRYAQAQKCTVSDAVRAKMTETLLQWMKEEEQREKILRSRRLAGSARGEEFG
jgi:phosphomannomutase